MDLAGKGLTPAHSSDVLNPAFFLTSTRSPTAPATPWTSRWPTHSHVLVSASGRCRSQASTIHTSPLMSRHGPLHVTGLLQ